MLFSIIYDIVSPLIVGYVEEMLVGDFALASLFAAVAVYAGILLFSMGSSYFQAIILQKAGQRIISDLREDLSSPTCGKTCSPTSSRWPMSSSTRSRWASWSPASPTTPTPSR